MQDGISDDGGGADGRGADGGEGSACYDWRLLYIEECSEVGRFPETVGARGANSI